MSEDTEKLRKLMEAAINLITSDPNYRFERRLAEMFGVILNDVRNGRGLATRGLSPEEFLVEKGFSRREIDTMLPTALCCIAELYKIAITK